MPESIELNPELIARAYAILRGATKGELPAWCQAAWADLPDDGKAFFVGLVKLSNQFSND